MFNAIATLVLAGNGQREPSSPRDDRARPGGAARGRRSPAPLGRL